MKELKAAHKINIFNYLSKLKLMCVFECYLIKLQDKFPHGTYKEWLYIRGDPLTGKNHYVFTTSILKNSYEIYNKIILWRLHISRFVKINSIFSHQ